MGYSLGLSPRERKGTYCFTTKPRKNVFPCSIFRFSAILSKFSLPEPFGTKQASCQRCFADLMWSLMTKGPSPSLRASVQARNGSGVSVQTALGEQSQILG